MLCCVQLEASEDSYRFTAVGKLVVVLIVGTNASNKLLVATTRLCAPQLYPQRVGLICCGVEKLAPWFVEVLTQNPFGQFFVGSPVQVTILTAPMTIACPLSLRTCVLSRRS